jgi:hypothetical protein
VASSGLLSLEKITGSLLLDLVELLYDFSLQSFDLTKVWLLIAYGRRRYFGPLLSTIGFWTLISR